MDQPSHDRDVLREGFFERDQIRDRGVDDLLTWIEDELLDQAGAGWGAASPTWIDVVQVLDSRSDLVVPIFRAMRLTGSDGLDARELLAADAEAFVAVGVVAGLIAPEPG